MSFSYVVSLNLAHRLCVVVGGGAVALRKIKSLQEENAEILVISPELCDELHRMHLEKAFQWIVSDYKEVYLKNAFLVIAATNQREVNQQIGKYCREHGILVNVIDSPQESTFLVNSSLKRGDLTISVSTNGVSPALSKKIREDLEKEFDERYGILLEIVKEAREEAMLQITDKKKRRMFLQELANLDLLLWLENEPTDMVREKVKKCLLSYLD